MKEKLDVKKYVYLDKEERILFQLKIGRRPTFTIWVSPELVIREEGRYFLEFPVENVELIQGKKDLILRPGSRNLFNIYTRCAWVGWHESSVIIDTYPYEILAYELDYNHHAALVLTSNRFVEYRWKMAEGQAGENFKTEEGFGVVHVDGITVEIEGEKEDAFASLV